MLEWQIMLNGQCSSHLASFAIPTHLASLGKLGIQLYSNIIIGYAQVLVYR